MRYWFIFVINLFTLNLMVMIYGQQIGVDNIRVLKSYLQYGVTFQCPLTGSPTDPNSLLGYNEILWINESTQSTKPDDQIDVVNNLLGSKSIYYLLFRETSDLSCGYFYKNSYVRIKKWKMTFVDNANVQLNINVDQNLIYFKRVNDSTIGINYLGKQSEISSISESSKLMKLTCQPNFDYPLSFTVLWLTYRKYNGNTPTLEERWSQFQINSNDSKQLFSHFRLTKCAKRV